MSATTITRDFEVSDAVLEKVPLFVGLVGPSSSGKTFSALRLAVGMQRVTPGPIIGIDTENRRMLHYANDFKFKHVDFGAPFGSLDYLNVLQMVSDLKPAAIIVDSMSHEHESVGGMVSFQEAELDAAVARASERGDRRSEWQIREAYNMLAWQKPKAARRALLQGITRLNANIICCFRAAEKVKPAKNEKGKTEIVEQGFTPIAGDEFIYEMTMSALFKAGAKGVPTWESEKPGELKAIKLPRQFEAIFKGGAMSEEHGEALAKWAIGGAEPAKRAGSIDIDALHVAGEAAARKGSHALKAWWGTLAKTERSLLSAQKDDIWKPLADKADAALQPAGEISMDEVPF